jgi:hypothetical protein
MNEIHVQELSFNSMHREREKKKREKSRRRKR